MALALPYQPEFTGTHHLDLQDHENV